MKTLRTLLVFSLVLVAATLFSQQNCDCTDIVYTRGGSVYRGKITEHTPGGNLVITTWSGIVFTVPATGVKRIVQRCKDGQRIVKPYDFKEHGLYNATRLGVQVGQNYFGDNAVGFALYHSTGWMFNRWLGAGIGFGAEIFNPDGEEVATYPVFAELRGYFLAKKVTPFYMVGGGWAFTGKNPDPRWGYTEDWDGGWLAKAQLGYRFGNNFSVYGGLSLQQKTRNWESVWGNDWGQDRILHKRLELGISVLL